MLGDLRDTQDRPRILLAIGALNALHLIPSRVVFVVHTHLVPSYIFFFFFCFALSSVHIHSR